MDEPTSPNGKKSEPRTIKPRGSKKYKEPSKDTVNIMASSFQDVYEIVDAALDMGVSFSGKEYPTGLFKLEDEKAQKLARSLAQMNSSSQRLAEKINKYSAPATFAAVLLGDLALKGAILYAALKSPKPNPESPITH